MEGEREGALVQEEEMQPLGGVGATPHGGVSAGI